MVNARVHTLLHLPVTPSFIACNSQAVYTSPPGSQLQPLHQANSHLFTKLSPANSPHLFTKLLPANSHLFTQFSPANSHLYSWLSAVNFPQLHSTVQV